MTARLGLDATTFLACWLAAWWFCAGVMLGAAVNLHIHTLTGGAWGDALRPAAARLTRRAAWLLPLFLPVAIGARWLFPWAGADTAWTHAMPHPGFAQAWFGGVFVAVRFVVYAMAGAWVLSGTGPHPTKGGAALRLIAFGLLGSLAAADLLMSLIPGWTSTVFPAIALVAQMASGAAACTVLAARETRVHPQAPDAPPVRRDLGNLLLMYVMLDAYLQYMQYLIIWAENLPKEIVWFLPRLEGGWLGMSQLLIAAQFAVPFLLLLFRRVKDSPLPLARVAGLFLAAHALGAAWLVVPSVRPHAMAAVVLLPLLFSGMALLLFGPAIRVQAKRAAA